MKNYIKLIMSRYYFSYKNNTIYDKYKMKKYKLKNLGKNIRLCDGWFIGNSNKLYIEDNVFISNQCYIDAIGGITIRSGTMIGPKFTCISANHVYDCSDLRSIPFDNRIINKSVEIGENVWIGGCVTINPGVKVGEGAVIGMGVVVYKDIPPYAIVVGNPMKIIKYRDEKQYIKLKAENKIFNKVFAGKEREVIE